MKALASGLSAALLREISRVIAADAPLALLAELANRQLPFIIVESAENHPWSSLTFVGQRHRFELGIGTAAPAAALVRLRTVFAEAVLTLRGHLVAEIGIAAAETGAGARFGIVVNALTIAD